MDVLKTLVGMHSSIRSFTFILILVSVCLSNKPFIAGEVFTLFNNSTKTYNDPPGPSMFFQESLSAANFQFEFKTFVKRALVLYQDGNERLEYVTLTLEEGRLHLAVQLKSEVLSYRLKSSKILSDFRWHLVEIDLRKGPIALSIDNTLVPDRKSYGSNADIHLNSNLQIGGFAPKRANNPNEIYDSKAFHIYMNITRRGFFNACVRNFKYKKDGEGWKEITDIVSERYHVTEGCHLNYCDKPDPICKNDGICTPIENNNVECDCRWTGFEGKKCTKTALELFLNGSYAIEYKIKIGVKALENEEYIFRIKTKRKNALILQAQGEPGTSDQLQIKIVEGKIVVNSNLGGNSNYDKLTSEINITDGKWHLVEYGRRRRKLSLVVDKNERKATNTISSTKDYVKMHYGSVIQIGKHNKLLKHAIMLQDFIWKHYTSNGANEVNFISGLFDSFWKRTPNDYTMIPKSALPKFNRILPVSSTPASTSVPTYSTPTPEGCIERDEIRCPRTEDSTLPAIHTDNVMGRKAGDDDDSSVTWIVVVTVICVLIIFVIIFFLVRKWNKRYSGDFEAGQKEIGPAATVVYYKDSGLKEKRRQVKI